MILQVLETNVKARLIRDKDSTTKGWWILPDGRRFHAYCATSWSFKEGEVAEGRIVKARREHPEHYGDNPRIHVDISDRFEIDQEKYAMPDFWYEMFAKRTVTLDQKVRGNFISDCKLCGAKRVNEQEHARLSGCFAKHADKVRSIQAAKQAWLDSFKTDGYKKPSEMKLNKKK